MKKIKSNKNIKKKGGAFTNNPIISNLKNNLINDTNLKNNIINSELVPVNKIKGAMDIPQNVSSIKDKIEEGLPVIDDKVMEYKKKIKKFIDIKIFYFFILPIILQTIITLLPGVIFFGIFIICINALISGINLVVRKLYDLIAKPLRVFGIRLKKPYKIPPIQTILWEGFLKLIGSC